MKFISLRTSLILLSGLPVCLGLQGAGRGPTYEVFAPLDGEWSGEFFVRKPDGTLVSRLQVTQFYRKVSETLQSCEIRNTVDGKTTVDHAENVIDGKGRLSCRVTKAGGEVVEHQGRAEGNQIFWSSVRGADAKGGLRVESFRERVAGDEYSIDGFGIYGDPVKGSLLFHGLYRRVRK